MRIVDCLATAHNLALVALAALVCVLGSWITISLLKRVRSTRAGARAAQKVFDKGGGVEAAATEAGRAASLAAMARGLSITDAAAASREACAAVTGD